MQRGISTAFLSQVRRTLARYEMVRAGERVLVALSGGPDSVALLAALVSLASELRIDVRAAHLNHQLRGPEALRDARCAQSVAERLGVPCAVGVITLAGQGNLEARARAARYAFLAEVADGQSCARIATGHTLDDQAETVLMRVLRGSGREGLSGIRPVRHGRIIRPLLECSRTQVLAFLRERELLFCEDSSNSDRRFLRNRVRTEVMPLLRALNPKAARHLAFSATTIAAEGEILEAQARTLLGDGSDTALRVHIVAQAPAGLRPRLVRTWLRVQRGDLIGVSAAQVHAVVELALGGRPNGQVGFPGGGRVVREYERLRWCWQERPVVPSECILLPGGSVCLTSGWRLSATVETGEAFERPRDLWGLLADAAAVREPLVVRTFRPGDRIRPLGVAGHRKLQDIFVDRKLPRAARRSIPVVECGGEILWVPGVVRGAGALVTDGTRSALSILAQRPGTGIAGG